MAGMNVENASYAVSRDLVDEFRKTDPAMSPDTAVERILERKDACWNRSQLAVNGGDILRTGVPRGPEVGRILDGLLEDVISGRVPNDRERLLRRIR